MYSRMNHFLDFILKEQSAEEVENVMIGVKTKEKGVYKRVSPYACIECLEGTARDCVRCCLWVGGCPGGFGYGKEADFSLTALLNII